MDAMCNIFEQRGKMSDADFDTFNIPPDEGNTVKDHLVLSRQRSIIFTYDLLIQRSIEEKRLKEELLLIMKTDIENRRIKRQAETARRKSDRMLMVLEDKYADVKKMKKRNMTPKKEDIERKKKTRNNILETASQNVIEI